MIEARSLQKRYGQLQAVDDVSFAVRAGEAFGLLGPNGAGKTTTIHMLCGVLVPDAGEVVIDGRSDPMRPEVRRQIGIAPQGLAIYEELTAAENLEMATLTGTTKADVEERAYSRFPRLAERRSQVAGTLSGGEQQMLSMARALATEPHLLLLDELSMGLAPIIVQGLYEQVAEIAREGLSIVVVEQFAHEVLGVADTAAIMLHGKVRRVGPPEQIAEELTDAYLSGSAG